jgi:coenzyme F420-reducing hydrogenase delta subunit
VKYVQKLLDEIGLNGRRIQMINVSAVMAGQFASAATEMASELKNIGPNPLRQEFTRNDGRTLHRPNLSMAGD